MTQHAVDYDPPSEPFADGRQQRHAATLGLWVFLAQETLFFGTIFVAFYYARRQFPADFIQGANELTGSLGGANTAVLLVSSYAVAQGVTYARRGDQRRVVRWFVLALVLGLAFVGIKGVEYAVDYHERLIPAVNYADVTSNGVPRGAHVKLFMCFYFFATGLHALHVIVGLGLLAYVSAMAAVTRFKANDANFIEGVSLYWHFVDLVWVFLYPTLYLLRH